MNIGLRLELLREKMKAQKLDLYLVPTIDAHNSEYVPECFARRQWISGFTGSAGLVIVSLDHAYLWTDGRYFLQAEQQLDAKYFTLLRQAGALPEVELWLKAHASGLHLGIDPRLVSLSWAQKLKELMYQLQGELVMVEENLIDLVRQASGEKISLPQSAAFYLDLQFSGASLTQRFAWLRHELELQQADYLLLNVLDEIAWLFNLRAQDIQYNPLLISYAVVSATTAYLFVDPAKINPKLRVFLSEHGVSLADYATVDNYLQGLSGTVWLDESTASYWMLRQISAKAKVITATSPIGLKKAQKNAIEITGAQSAHRKDAVALINFLQWLEQQWPFGVDEIAASDYLTQMRAQQANFRGPSFATISAYGANGAIIHYHATAVTNKLIAADSLYLLDSGGQYLDGTTDVTRTIHLGIPSKEQRRHYTLVLKAHLALGRTVFPHGTCGEQLDAIARAPLWQEYLNYRHGTGHGVGSFLCVHEGPPRIAPAPATVPLLPGMIVSNEPGLYFSADYGIRIENLCLVQEVGNEVAQKSEYGPFYQFTNLTLVPYCKKLIEVSMLSTAEQQQIINYYQQIRQEVIPLLLAPQQQWLEDELDLF
jgi:Xaa-Pro aminopeptidase